MKILLGIAVLDSYQSVPDIGMGYLLAALRNKGHEVFYFDGTAEKYTPEQFEAMLREVKPDFVGFKIYSLAIGTVNKFFRIAKDVNPNIVTMGGGPHPSILGHRAMKHLPLMDYAFQGEAEFSLPKLIEALEKDGPLEDIAGLIYRADEGIKSNPRYFHKNIEDFGRPAWDLVDPNKYESQSQVFFLKHPVSAPIVTSRGCPFPCDFCGVKHISGTKFRTRSPEDIIDELLFLKKNFGIKEFSIWDDIFNLDKKHVANVCNALIENNLKMDWTIPQGIRVNNLDREILELMKRAGCYTIGIGIESGSPKILDDMKKHLTVEQIEEKVRLISSTGIKVAGFFIIGYPTEEVSDIEKTIKFACSLPLGRALFHIYKPNPGSEAYKKLEEQGLDDGIDFETFSLDVASVSTTTGITPEELKAFHQKAYKKFYMRPGYMLKILAEFNSLGRLAWLLKRGYKIFQKN